MRGSAAKYLLSASAGRDGRMLFLARPSSCASSVSSQAMKALASGTCFEPIGIATTSPPTNEETWPSFTPGRKVTPKFMFGTSRLRSEMRKPPQPWMPILPDLNRAVKFAPLSACALFGHEALAPHLLELFEHVLDALAGQRVVIAIGGQHFRTRGHHHRRRREDVAAGAGAREIEAVGVGPEGVDLFGVLVDLGDAARRLFGIEAGFLEQILVPDQDRNVRREARAVELALVGGDVDIGLRDGREVWIGLEVGGEVGEEPGLHEIGHVDEIEGDEVGRPRPPARRSRAW